MVEEDDATLDDDEVGSLRAGYAAVKLSKFTFKVFGWPISLNYIQMKLLALWKPASRLDYVDLEKDFYLVRFSLKEDHDVVLRKGPWFLGEHFLSIRP